MDTSRIKRVLLSLPTAALRLGWLQDRVGRAPAADGATLLNALLEESEAAEPAAREVAMTVVLFFLKTEATLRHTMYEVAQERQLFSLERLLRRGPQPAVAMQRADEGPVPDYGTGRELTLGERRSLARKPNRALFDKLLSDPHPMVIRQLLSNPKMVEDDAVRLATRRPARREIVRELGRSARWLSRSRVRLAILLNPGSPLDTSVPLLVLCTRAELREVLASTDTSLVLRATAKELIERRPPMEEPEQTGLLQ